MSILRMRPKTNFNMISIFPSCDAHTILVTVTAYHFDFLFYQDEIIMQICTYVTFANICQMSLKCKRKCS